MRNTQEKGITLIALIITIIVMIILAGVAIAAVVNGGLFDQAKASTEETKFKAAEEKVNMMVGEYITEEATEGTNIKDFFNRKKDLGEIEKVIEYVEGQYIVIQVDGYKFKIDEETLKVEAGVAPKAKANLYQTNGNDLVEGAEYEEIIITVEVTNKSELGVINEIILKDTNGVAISKVSKIGIGEESFKVPGEGKYTAIITATTDGIQKTTTIIIDLAVPSLWEATTSKDAAWYAYADVSSGAVVKVNAPKATELGLTPIKYIGTNPQTGSKWANATLKDGSMMVWIPRYSYKIIYYTEQDYINLSGNNGTTKTKFGKIDIKFSNGTTDNTSDGYIVHPAFTNAGNGGFGELTGIWVGKFESSRSDAKVDSDGTSTDIKIKPSVKSYKSVTVKDAFNAAWGMRNNTEKYGITAGDTHMMKNTEWGCVAYLTHSKYGKNGKEISLNQCTSYITGAGPGIGGNEIYNSTYTYNNTTFMNLYAYSTNQGLKASTTGNIYGIYDMSGGESEYVMGVYNKTTCLSGFADSLTDIPDTKYYDNYPTSYALSSSIKGDAIFETSTSGDGSASWLNDGSDYLQPLGSWFLRGRNCLL